MFKIGDIVKGKSSANIVYGVTVQDWIGEVIGVLSDNLIRVKGIDKDASDYDEEYTVDAQHFELCKKTEQSPPSKCKLRFSTSEGKRYVSRGKHKGEAIDTITTTVYDSKNMKICGSATCDKANYDERQGILEAIGNMVYSNFDREYNKTLAQKKKINDALCKCSCCGKTYKTPEEADACELTHIERKAAKRENYLLRKAAKKRAREMKIEQMAKDIVASEQKTERKKV